MPDADQPPSQEPLRVSILTQGGYLIASIHTALDDGQLRRFRDELLEQIGLHRSQGVIIDVAALDVIDSFACHTLRTIAQVARLRGAETVIVGIQPDVALAMVRLGRPLETWRPPSTSRKGSSNSPCNGAWRAVSPGPGSTMTDQLDRLRQNYRARFLRYLGRRDEWRCGLPTSSAGRACPAV